MLELDQIAAHGGGQLGALALRAGPLPVGLVLGDPGLEAASAGAHALMASRASSSAACPASMSSAAWRYSSASQSLVRCR